MELITIIAVFTAFLVKGICGFANTLVLGSILSFSQNTISITPVDLIVGLPANVLIAVRERKSIDYKVFVPLSLLVIAGIIPGVIFLKNGNVNLLKVLFGFAVILIGIETLLRERKEDKKGQSKILLGVIGVVSGILCGLFGVGAFLVAYIGRTTETPSQFRGNICAVFLMENLFRLALYFFSGIITKDIFILSIKLIPVMIIGLMAGIGLSKIINEAYSKKIITVMLVLTGVSLIISNII